MRHLKEQQSKSCESNNSEFWKTIGEVVLGPERNIIILIMEIKTVDETYSCDLPSVLTLWKSCFQQLFAAHEHYPYLNKNDAKSDLRN